MINKENLKNLIKDNKDILSLFDYGSSVYGTRGPQSDYDFILVVENNFIDVNLINELEKYGDINVFKKDEFMSLINEHEITALECLFLSPNNILKNTCEWSFNLHLPTLRNSLSAKSSNSWVKAKKKFIVEKDINEYVGKKSAWHAIRILDFGEQIAVFGSIKDYTRVNYLLSEFLACSSWEEIDTKFRKTYNEYSTKFKLVAPKEVNLNKLKP